MRRRSRPYGLPQPGGPGPGPGPGSFSGLTGGPRIGDTVVVHRHSPMGGAGRFFDAEVGLTFLFDRPVWPFGLGWSDFPHALVCPCFL